MTQKTIIYKWGWTNVYVQMTNLEQLAVIVLLVCWYLEFLHKTQDILDGPPWKARLLGMTQKVSFTHLVEQMSASRLMTNQ